MSNSNNSGLSKWVDFLGNDTYELDWTFDISADDIKKFCSHEWVDQGFMHQKLCCKFCDIEKRVWEEYQAKTKAKKAEQSNDFRY